MTSPIQQKIEELRNFCGCEKPVMGELGSWFCCGKRVGCNSKNYETLLDVIEKLSESNDYYGYKIVPDSLNSGRTTITTETGRRAREALTAATEMLGRVK